MTEDELFLTAILACDRTALYTHPAPLTQEQKVRLEGMRSRRKSGEPVQYICGFTEFMGLRFEVGPGVLVPRPETEILVDEVIQILKAEDSPRGRVLDIGTGSGCIAVSMVKALKMFRALGVDISHAALSFARRNSTINEVEDRVDFLQADGLAFLEAATDPYDAVIANPPYIPSLMILDLPQDVRHEPVVALDGGPDGLDFYRRIIPGALNALKTGGLLALEFGDGQNKEIENLFLISGEWDKINFIKDNAGKYRIALARKH